MRNKNYERDMVHVHLQETDSNAKLQAFSRLVVSADDHGEREVELKARDRVRVHEPDTGSHAGRAVCHFCDGIGHAGFNIGTAAGDILQRDEAAAVEERLEAERRCRAKAREGCVQRHTAGIEQITTDSIVTVSWAHAVLTESPDVGGTANEEAVVYAGVLGCAFGAGERDHGTSAQPSGDRAAVREGEGVMGLELVFGESDVAAESTESSDFGDVAEVGAGSGEQLVIAGVAREGVAY